MYRVARRYSYATQNNFFFILKWFIKKNDNVCPKKYYIS